MEFVKITKTNFLTIEQMDDIYNNFMFFKEVFENFFGKTIDIEDNRFNTSDGLIRPSFLGRFNAVENNIQMFHNVFVNFGAAFIDENYYKEFSWQPYTQDRFREVWRWIDWMDEVYDYVKRIGG